MMNRRSFTWCSSRRKFRRLRDLSGTMSPVKAIYQPSGKENEAFEEDDPSLDNVSQNNLSLDKFSQDNFNLDNYSLTVPKDTSPRCPGNARGNASNAAILGDTAELLASAAEHLRCCADCLTRQLDAANETPKLVSQARLHSIKKMADAVSLVAGVTERLKKSLKALQRTKPEKVFTPVLINTLTKESTQIERISQNLSADNEDTARLDQDLREIRTSILRCIDAFEPVRQAVFRPNRRGNECDRVGNQTREYLRSLDVDWRGLCQAKEALPRDSRLPSIKFAVDVDSRETLTRRSSSESLFESEARRYWPV